jgi:hypothetical protein
LNNGATTDELQHFTAIEPIFESSPPEDLTYYSIPPAFTRSSSESNDRDDFQQDSVITSRPSAVHHDLHNTNSRPLFKFETEFNSFDNDDYPPYPPFLTEQSLRQQQQLSPDVSPAAEKSLPKYVIGVAGEEGTEDNFFDTKPRSPSTVRRQQTIYQPDSRQTVPAELDESPFARRTLRYVNVEDLLPRYNNRPSRFNRRRSAAEDISSKRNIRNGHYIASKVLPVIVDEKDLY